MTELITPPATEPRRLVPTVREHAVAIQAEPLQRTSSPGPPKVTEQPASAVTAAESVPRRPMARDVLRQFDPRGATQGSPSLPMVVAALSGFFANAEATSFGILLLAIQQDLHFRSTSLAIIGQVTIAFVLLLAPVSGFLADRVNRVRLAGAGELLSNITILAGAVTPNVGGLLASRAVNGLGGALKGPVQLPLLVDWYPSAVRGRVIAFVASWGFLGSVLGPLLAAGLAELGSWRLALGVIGGAGTLAALLWLLLREPVRGELDRLEQGIEPERARIEPPPLSWAESWRVAASVATIRRLWYAAPFLAVAGSLVPLLFVQYFSAYYGLSILQISYIGVAGAIVSYASLSFAGPVVQRFVIQHPSRVLAMLAGCFTVAALSLVLVFFAPYLWMALAGVAINNALTAFSLPASSTLIALVVPPRIRGFGLSTTAVWSLGGILGGFMLLTSTPNQEVVFGTVSVVLLVGALVIGTAGGSVAADARAAATASLADEDLRQRRLAGLDQTLLLCRDVGVTYGSSRVLFGVELEVREGELIALLGTNGAGKSTLLRAVTGLQEAGTGVIYFDGEDITHKPPHEIAELGIVFIPGGRAVFPSLTVEENLRAANWRERDDAVVGQRVAEVLELFPELAPRLGEQAGNLSGGEQQMVALGMALVGRPRLLLIDELSLGLAPAIVERLLGVVRRLNADGTTVLLVEQSVNVALTIAERALFMDKGEIRFDGAPADLLERTDLVRSVFFQGAESASGGPVLSKRRTSWLRPPAADAAPRVSVDGITLAYGGHTVLRDVTFDLTAGEICGVIGPNGAGKSSLLDVLTGFAKPQAGTVRLGEVDVTCLPPVGRARLGLGRSFQNARLFTHLTARENIAVALEKHLTSRSALVAALWLPPARQSQAKAQARADYLIELLGLEAYADKFVSELSVGTRRMLDIACIMASEPSVLLLDEPSSGVAQAEIEVFAPVITRLARDTDCSILVVEHDIPLVTAMSDRLLVLELGRVIAMGEPREVLDRPDVIAAYLAGADPAVIHRSGETRRRQDLSEV